MRKIRFVRHAFIGLVLAFLLASCANLSSVQEELVLTPQVTWGQPAGDSFPSVGTMLFVPADFSGFFSCSGTLIDSSVFLTAGHCTDGNAFTWVTFESAPNFDDFDSEAESIYEYLDREWLTGTSVAHPGWTGRLTIPNTHDVGVVLLDAPVLDVPTMNVAPVGYLDALATRRGRQNTQFTVVGYGSQGILPPITVDEYARYYGTVSLVNLRSAFVKGYGLKTSNNPGRGNGSGGVCFGDSGGPIIHGEGSDAVVVAVTSFGITPCIGVDYAYRVDTTVTALFLEGEMAE